MKTFNVYFRHNGSLTHAFVEAPTLADVKWRLLARFYNASISNIVEMKGFKTFKTVS